MTDAIALSLLKLTADVSNAGLCMLSVFAERLSALKDSAPCQFAEDNGDRCRDRTVVISEML